MHPSLQELQLQLFFPTKKKYSSVKSECHLLLILQVLAPHGGAVGRLELVLQGGDGRVYHKWNQKAEGHTTSEEVLVRFRVLKIKFKVLLLNYT